jgi:hypothetical protein
MITEDYVSFEIAKLLKKKGFTEYTLGYYLDDKDKLYFDRFSDDWNSKHVGYICAPTLWVAMKWLREVHNIAIDTEWEHLWYAYVKPMTSKPSENDYYQCESSKYEEACESAIKYCLENLITE